MAAYAYQQNFYEGASTGYIKFNASPDLGMPVAPGEQIVFEGELYSKNYAVASVEIGLYSADSSNRIYPTPRFNVSAKKGAATAFRIALTMPEAAEWFPSGRTVPLTFKFTVSRADGSGDVLTPTAAQRLLWLRYRIKPEILRAEFYRYGIDADSGLYERKNDGSACMCAGLQLSLASGCTAADITIARITTGVQRSTVRVNLPSAVLERALGAGGYTETEPAIFSGMSFNPGSAHVLLIEIGDEYDIAAGNIVLPRSFANMCLCNFEKGGVSFGGFPKSTEGNPLFENYYPLRQYADADFYGGIGNIQAGYVDALGSTASGSHKDGAVIFPKAFAAGTVPVVVIGFQYTSAAGSPGDMSVAVVSTTNTGFTFRFYNGNSSARNPAYSYIAFGIPGEGG